VAHVITQACCGDAACVYACPVNAIQPNPDHHLFVSAEMLYIDPSSCVDCGACVPACPVGAIKKDTRLPIEQQPFIAINRLYHEAHGTENRPVQAIVPTLIRLPSNSLPIRVAIVGSGPAAMYAADELLKQDGVEVAVFDRLQTPYGLARAGVAPDHESTRSIDRLFRRIEGLPGFHYALGVEVGKDVTHQQLLERFSAVIYATGAARDKLLDLPGAHLPGVTSATTFVGWYNGHPDHADAQFDLEQPRVVLIGNGNVALDVARILTTEPSRLASTDISRVALKALRESHVEEVVVLGRRGPEHSAFTLPELVGLTARDDLEVVLADPVPPPPEWADVQLQHKLDLLRSLPLADIPRRGRRIVLRYWTTPTGIRGDSLADGVEVSCNPAQHPNEASSSEFLPAGLIISSIGYRGVQVPALPFDESNGVIPHQQGRVEGARGTYVVGWIKRGPSGFIGTNKTCARETVNSLLEDLSAGPLTDAPITGDLSQLLRRWHPHSVDLNSWRDSAGLTPRRNLRRLPGRGTSRVGI
jgi:ferredoxin--NADP+ reductase